MEHYHLELFLFRCETRRESQAAVRNIPYGIQQPAVSGQIAKLEGVAWHQAVSAPTVRAFRRQVWSYSSLSNHSSTNVEIVGEKLRQNRSPQLRIARRQSCCTTISPELLQKLSN